MIDTLKIQNLVFLLFVVLSIISSNDSTNYALVFLPSYFGIFVKFIDFFMTVKNAYYYFDMYFLFNMSLLFTVHDLEINTKQTETVIFLFVSCLVLQLSLVEFYFIEILHKLLNSFFNMYNYNSNVFVFLYKFNIYMQRLEHVRFICFIVCFTKIIIFSTHVLLQKRP